jgi:hypothetical protein
MKILSKLLLLTLTVVGFMACDEEMPELETRTFRVTIENIQEGKDYLASGEIAGLTMPGEMRTFTFNAGKGSYLNFATMFVQSNDLFYGFGEQGLKLYDDNGNPVTGDVTAQVELWDAGTEVNEMPGTGPNQAPRQAAGNTGGDENGTIQVVNDGFTYPANNTVIEVSLTHDGGTEFTATIKNISGSATLATPFAPGLWVVHGDGVQLFENGATASAGLEALAEDGDNAMMLSNATATTGYVSPFAPGVYALHKSGVQPIFTENSADRGEGLEALAEDGDASTLDASLTAASDVSKNGIFDTPDGASAAGPLMPSNSYSFTVEAEEGDYLSLATMLVHTNDLFYGFGQGGIALFDGQTPISGDMTSKVFLWDAGTEVNEYPGAGNNQPARGGANSGIDEGGNIMLVNDSFTYPATTSTIRVTITPQ